VNETYVTVVGNAVTGVTLRVTDGGTPMATFRVASTPRRFDREHNSWQDGPSSFYSVTCWRALAENAYASIKVGQPVLVTGRQRVRPWTGRDGRAGLSVEIDAVALGHDLTRGQTAFEKVRRGQGGDAQAQASEAALAELAAEPVQDVDPFTGEIRQPIARDPWADEADEAEETDEADAAEDADASAGADELELAAASGDR
jgi:single-strand DNA-binding protein